MSTILSKNKIWLSPWLPLCAMHLQVVSLCTYIFHLTNCQTSEISLYLYGFINNRIKRRINLFSFLYYASYAYSFFPLVRIHKGDSQAAKVCRSKFTFFSLGHLINTYASVQIFFSYLNMHLHTYNERHFIAW